MLTEEKWRDGRPRPSASRTALSPPDEGIWAYAVFVESASADTGARIRRSFVQTGAHACECPGQSSASTAAGPIPVDNSRAWASDVILLSARDTYA